MENDMEIVYGTNEDSPSVMSERVSTLASSVYKEFERMIQKYDEDVVKELMPLVVSVLESLDLSYQDNQEHEVELELLREDNEQLVTQYEREKQLRKASEQKYFEVEDAIEEETKKQEEKVELLESFVRMLELKGKNASDHVARLDEKEADAKREYSTLHDRYTELFKTHMDYVERTKLIMSSERNEPLVSPGVRNRQQGFSFAPRSPQVAPAVGVVLVHERQRSGSPSSLDQESLRSPRGYGINLESEIEGAGDNQKKEIATEDKSQLTDRIGQHDMSTGWTDSLTDTLSPDPEVTMLPEETQRPVCNPTRCTDSLFSELSFQDSDVIGLVDEGADITGYPVNTGDYASSDSGESDVSDTFFGMSKEVENLILENTELLATKNALNIVKDDLIAKVDELTSEQEILREEIRSLQEMKGRLQARVHELEAEMRKLKEAADKNAKGNMGEDEDDVPMAQRKRFTRVEMARVLMERNQYKERLMELQEAVRWTEMIRASKLDPTLETKRKSSIWKFCLTRLAAATRAQQGLRPAPVSRSRIPKVVSTPTGATNKHEHTMREKEAEQHSSSSLVWICTSTSQGSKAAVIDANNPADILDAFRVCSAILLCIASVPGATESDYLVDDVELPHESTSEDVRPAEKEKQDRESEEKEDTSIKITFVSCATGASSTSASPERSLDDEKEESGHLITEVTPSGDAEKTLKGICPDDDQERQVSAPSSRRPPPTMWLGSQSGSVYVHSSMSQWKRCIHSVKLKDSVLAIVHIKGRVFIALADGTVAVFHRASDGQWDLSSYHLIDLGRPHHSIRCMTVVIDNIWCGYRNRVHVVNSKTLEVEMSFDAHPRKESQVRQMSWVGDGVWISIRLDSTLRLYHAHTHQHLQDVDIEPYVSKMLGTGKLGFSFVRITALHVSCNRLWMGTGNGVIISVPLSESNKQQSSGGVGKPGGVVRVYSDTRTDSVKPGTFVPYCSMAQAQLSFHGHRDAVKFFVAIREGDNKNMDLMATGSNKELSSKMSLRRHMLVLSGGEGYIDFRIGIYTYIHIYTRGGKWKEEG
ncbi:PREDICTED: C-Jun-amino-terminal kinase-interacting protein 3-like [Priapulus caudatus]|uniref:C-Jun-amino-terminal kinase-interacting protein 3-like n=1 Tax=Priapulus caudatus TaxID=37621 RepID=A0ABM1E989_PRICU|nr:PREDICTED: C-Jun-amino-terminal kinase-interacting protein 3-like [Priapulus caudatus]